MPSLLKKCEDGAKGDSGLLPRRRSKDPTGGHACVRVPGVPQQPADWCSHAWVYLKGSARCKLITEAQAILPHKRAIWHIPHWLQTHDLQRSAYRLGVSTRFHRLVLHKVFPSILVESNLLIGFQMFPASCTACCGHSFDVSALQAKLLWSDTAPACGHFYAEFERSCLTSRHKSPKTWPQDLPQWGESFCCLQIKVMQCPSDHLAHRSVHHRAIGGAKRLLSYFPLSSILVRPLQWSIPAGVAGGRKRPSCPYDGATPCRGALPCQGAVIGARVRCQTPGSARCPQCAQRGPAQMAAACPSPGETG